MPSEHAPRIGFPFLNGIPFFENYLVVVPVVRELSFVEKHEAVDQSVLWLVPTRMWLVTTGMCAGSLQESCHVSSFQSVPRRYCRIEDYDVSAVVSRSYLTFTLFLAYRSLATSSRPA
jgi:hypothetical protein